MRKGAPPEIFHLSALALDHSSASVKKRELSQVCAIVTKSHAPSMNIAELGERSRGREMALHWKLKRGLEPRWGSWTKTFAAGVTSSALEICNKLPGGHGGGVNPMVLWAR